jgi:two-component sensor histidine kinase
MDKDPLSIQSVLRQQTAIADFHSFTLQETDLLKILSEAARLCAKALNAPFCKVCRYRAVTNDLLIEAGYGWQTGVVGQILSRADETSPQGRAFASGEPLIYNPYGGSRFEPPPFYAGQGIVSTIIVIIRGHHKPYGILEIDSNEQTDYQQSDIDFLIGFANVLAKVIEASERMTLMQKAVERMRMVIEDKDDQLAQKKILADELQHRVRHDFQLIFGMLSKQIDDATSQSDQRGLKAISRRVATLAQIYDHLLGAEMTRATDFGSYVKSLCRSLAEVQSIPDDTITLTCNSETLILDLDTVTALGIIVAELVANSYDHAFPSGTGAAFVSVRRASGNDHMATLTVGDTGQGFNAMAESKRHGLGLVRRLVEQIRGTVTMDLEHGTVWKITFPAGPVSLAESGGRGPSTPDFQLAARRAE